MQNVRTGNGLIMRKLQEMRELRAQATAQNSAATSGRCSLTKYARTLERIQTHARYCARSLRSVLLIFFFVSYVTQAPVFIQTLPPMHASQQGVPAHATTFYAQHQYAQATRPQYPHAAYSAPVAYAAGAPLSHSQQPLHFTPVYPVHQQTQPQAYTIPTTATVALVDNTIKYRFHYMHAPNDSTLCISYLPLLINVMQICDA